MSVSSPIHPWIVSTPAWGDVQGHNLLAKHLAAAGCGVRGWSASPVQRLAARLLRRSGAGRGLAPAVAWELFVANRLSRRHLVHLAWGDDYITRVAHPENCFFTLHQPLEKWNDAVWRAIGRSAGILTMADREARAIASRYPDTPVAYTPHGIATDFWAPRPSAVSVAPKRIAVVGRYLRNFEMLVRVCSTLLARRSDTEIRWLVNPDFHMPPAVAARLPADRFRVVSRLSAERLRDFYCESWLFFTPYDNVTASNAIVEALACGTPVFTTNVGGMAGYAAEGMTLVQNNDDNAMLAALERVLDDPAERARLAAAARAHAERTFDWRHIVDLHLRFYAAAAAGRRAALPPRATTPA